MTAAAVLLPQNRRLFNLNQRVPELCWVWGSSRYMEYWHATARYPCSLPQAPSRCQSGRSTPNNADRRAISAEAVISIASKDRCAPVRDRAPGPWRYERQSPGP